MMRKWISAGIVAILIAMTMSICVFAADQTDSKDGLISFGNDEEYGTIYGAEYDPAAGNNSKWMTVKLGENGLRIINNENNEIIMVDKYGGVYVKGTFYLNGEKVNIDNKKTKFDSGFLYFLIVINLGISGYLLLKSKK